MTVQAAPDNPAPDVNIRQAFDRILSSTKQLPSPPEVCLAVTQAAQSDNTSLADMQSLVESDMALSARLIQVANSSFFGVRERISSVRRAITLLGFSTVRTLALGFFYHEEFGKLRLPGLPYPDLPHYSLASSAVAEAVAERVAPDLAADASCLALLQDSGVIVMAMAFGNQYRRMLSTLPGSGQTLWQAELQAFGVDHAAASKLLLMGWKIRPPFVEAIGNHHQPQMHGCDDPQAVQLWKILSLASAGGLLFFDSSRSAGTSNALELARQHFAWDGQTLGDVIKKAAPSYRQRSGVFSSSPAHDASAVSALLR